MTDSDEQYEALIVELMKKHGLSRKVAEEAAQFQTFGPDLVEE